MPTKYPHMHECPLCLDKALSLIQTHENKGERKEELERRRWRWRAG